MNPSIRRGDRVCCKVEVRCKAARLSGVFLEAWEDARAAADAVEIDALFPPVKPCRACGGGDFLGHSYACRVPIDEAATVCLRQKKLIDPIASIDDAIKAYVDAGKEDMAEFWGKVKKEVLARMGRNDRAQPLSL